MAEMTLEQKVKEVIDQIRPQLQMDGGDIEFLGLEGKKVKVRLQGACACCPSAQMTLHMGVERMLKAKVPEIEGVVPV